MDINFGLGVFGAFGTVIGFLGFLFYLRDRRRVELRYEFINDILIGKEVKALPDGITIQYRGQPLKSLQKSNLILWNRSTQSLKQTDLARPLMVTFPATAEVFAMRIELQSAEENGVRITARNENTITFEFEYLSVNQGFNVEFLYSSEDGQPVLSAVLIESPKGLINNKDARPKNFLRRHVTISNMISLTIGMVGVIAWRWKSDATVPYVVLFVSAVPVTIAGILSLQFQRNVDGKPIPKNLILQS